MSMVKDDRDSNFMVDVHTRIDGMTGLVILYNEIIFGSLVKFGKVLAESIAGCFH